MSKKITNSYGGNRGTQSFSAAVVNSIGLHGAKYIDAIIVNDVQYGGSGGHASDPTRMILAPGEYVNNIIVIYFNEYVSYLRFKTNLNNSVEIGTSSVGSALELSNIRLLSIEGQYDNLLDQITFTYIEGYNASVQQEQGVFILSMTPPNTKMTQYQEAEMVLFSSYEQISSSMTSQNYSASAGVDFGVQASASTNLTFQTSDTTTIKSALQNKLTTATTMETSIPAGQVGVLLVKGQIMQSEGGQYWMHPISQPQYTVLSMDNTSFQDMYDLNGLLFEQVPGLHSVSTTKNGYTYYGS